MINYCLTKAEASLLNNKKEDKTHDIDVLCCEISISSGRTWVIDFSTYFIKVSFLGFENLHTVTPGYLENPQPRLLFTEYTWKHSFEEYLLDQN